MSYLQPGTLFANDFRIVRHLSAGGMGSVFVVEQLSTGKERALKVMHRELSDDPSHRTRFESEARISASIESDHVVEVLAAGIEAESGIPWLVMELLRGETLEAHVQQHGPMGVAAVRECAKQLRHVLEQAHMMGLVHRDLKPENLFLASAKRQDVPFTLKVLDFGIAKWAQEAKSTLKNSQMIGSPLWMAPEQLHTGAIISAATDVWALGLIAFFLLTGKHYWATANAASPSITGLLLEVAGNPMPPASQRAAQFAPDVVLPEGFDAWFAQTSNRDMSQRFEHAGGCLDALVSLLADRASLPPAAGALLPRGDVVAFDTVAISGSEDPEMLLRIARVYELRDTDRPRAAQAYRRVLELAPTSAEAYDALSQLLEGMGDWAELDALLVRQASALSLPPEALSRIWLRIATLRRDRRHDETGHFGALRNAFDADPRDRAATVRIVEASHDPSEIEQFFSKARAAGQDVAFLETLAGDVAAARGDLGAAEAAYARALAADSAKSAMSDRSVFDSALRAKFARAGAASGVVGPEEVRVRWARVLEGDLLHVGAWEGIVSAAEKMGDPEDLALVIATAQTILGEAAAGLASRPAPTVPATKARGLEFDAARLAAIAEHSLDSTAVQPLLVDVPAKAPLKSFGFTLKELVDPMTSSRALLQRAMPIYRQLTAAGVALDLPSTPQVYFKEGAEVGFVRLWSEPAAIVIQAGMEAWAAEEITFAAYERLTATRGELSAYASFLAGEPTRDAGEAAFRYLHAAERLCARVAFLATRSLSAARKALEARPTALLSVDVVVADLALFVATGGASRALAAAREAA